MSNESNLFSGVLSASLTPMDANMEPDHKALENHCRWLLKNGCDGLAILGTTGEANSYSMHERKEIIQILVESGIPAAKMMPGTGCCALEDTVSLTRVAVNSGAGGVLMLPPFYYKNVSDDGLFAYYSEVIQRLGDDKLKIYLYHFPQMSGVPINLELIARLRKAYPDTVVGMKDSSGNFENMQPIMKEFPGFVFLSGADDLLLPVLKAGGHGCITACSNIAAPLLAKVYADWTNGVEATEEHQKLVGLRNVMGDYVLFSAIRALMARHTGLDEWLNIRLPLQKLSDSDSQALFREFDKLGIEIPNL